MPSKVHITILVLLSCAGIMCDGLLYDQDPPTVVSCVPSSNASEVSQSTSIELVFSEEMDREATERAFSLTADGETLQGTTSWEGNTLRFIPLYPLLPNPEYLIRLDVTAEDCKGNNLLKEFVSRFSVAGRSVKPYVEWHDPGENQQIAGVTNSIRIGFSAAMNPGTVYNAFTLSPALVGKYSMESNIRVFVFTPTVRYVHGTRYSASISQEAQDGTGNPLKEGVQFSFLAGTDFIPPAIVSIRTQAGAPLLLDGSVNHGISKRSTLQIEFSKDMDPQKTQDAVSIEPSVAGFFSVSGTTMTFTPQAAFASETMYTVRVKTTATDVVGNAVRTETVVRFMTDAVDSRYLRVQEIRGPSGVAWVQNQMVPLTGQTLSNVSIYLSAPTTLLSIINTISVSHFSGTVGSTPDIMRAEIQGGQVLNIDLRGMAESGVYKIVISQDAEDIWMNPLKEAWVLFFQT